MSKAAQTACAQRLGASWLHGRVQAHAMRLEPPPPAAAAAALDACNAVLPLHPA